MIERYCGSDLRSERRGISVYHSGSGYRLVAGRGRRAQSSGRACPAFVGALYAGSARGWIHRAPQRSPAQDSAGEGSPSIGERAKTQRPRRSDSEPQARSTSRKTTIFSVHRVEQIGVPVSANEAYTVDVVARPRGRDRLIIEFRDQEAAAYTRATFDLKKAQIAACMDKDAVAIGAIDDEWVRCQLTLTPTSNVAVFNVTLVDQVGAHIYQGEEQAGIDIRPPVVGRSLVGSLAG